MSIERFVATMVLSATVVGPVAAQSPGTVKFTIHYEGPASAQGVGTWSGRLSGPSRGVIAIRLEHVAQSPAGVHALVFVSDDEKMSRSFGADVAGRVTSAGTAQLAGRVNVGESSGKTVQLSMELCTNAGGCRGSIKLVDVDRRIPASVMQYPPQEVP